MPVIGLLEGQRLRYRLGAAEFSPEEWDARAFSDPHDRAKRTTDWLKLYLENPAAAEAQYFEANRGSLDPEYEPDILSYLRNHGGVPAAPVAPATPTPTTSDPGNTSVNPPVNNHPLMTDAEYQKFLADQIAYANNLANQPRANENIQPDPGPMPTPAPASPAAPETKSLVLPIAAAILAWMVLK